MTYLINPYLVQASGPTDPNISSVKLLLGFPGTDASTTVVDESPAAHGTATMGGTAQIDTAQSKFGSSSLLLDASAGCKISYGDSADWAFGSGNFTIEFFMRFNVATGGQYFMGQWDSGSGNLSWITFILNGDLYLTDSTTGSDNLNHVVGTSTGITNNTWYHICYDFDGTKYRVYVDGVMKGSSTTLRTLFNSTLGLTIGDLTTNAAPLNGWLDEVRITKGVARYASDAGFTPPTAAFPRA